jgi:hypothetical protein
MPAQAFVQADTGVYAGKQSAKGTAKVALLGAQQFTKMEVTPEILRIDGVPQLGPNGFYMAQSLGTAVKTTVNGEGWLDLGIGAAILLQSFMTKGTTTGSAAYTHPHTAIVKNSTMPYLTLGFVYGESTSPGTGITGGTHILRDMRPTAFTLTISSTDAIKFTGQWQGLNMGAGSSPTFTPGAAQVIPNPNGTANTYTFPSWIPVGVCCNSVQLAWTAQTVQAPPCLGAGEYGDILIEQAGWELTFRMQLDVNSIIAYNQILAKADTLGAGTSALIPGLKTGAFSFLANSDTVVPTTSTPNSLAGSFPSLQWVSARITNESPNMLEIVARTFGGDYTFSPTNAIAGGSYAI